MKFEISLQIDKGTFDRAQIINDLSQSLKEFFIDKTYGEDIDEILISFLCVNPPESHLHLYKVHPPKFVEHKILKNKFTGEQFELSKYFNYFLKFSEEEYDLFISLSDKESEKMLANEILKSLSSLDNLPKKVKDFDKEKFKSDMKFFFTEKELI